MILSTHLSNLDKTTYLVSCRVGRASYAHKLNKANIALCFALYCSPKGAE